jgi:hypothetical protein
MIVPTKNPREPKYIDATIINNTNKPIMINSFFNGFLNFIFHSQDNGGALRRAVRVRQQPLVRAVF